MIKIRAKLGQGVRIGEAVIYVENKSRRTVGVAIDAPRHVIVSRVDDAHPLTDDDTDTSPQTVLEMILHLLATGGLSSAQRRTIAREVAQ